VQQRECKQKHTISLFTGASNCYIYIWLHTVSSLKNVGCFTSRRLCTSPSLCAATQSFSRSQKPSVVSYGLCQHGTFKIYSILNVCVRESLFLSLALSLSHSAQINPLLSRLSGSDCENAGLVAKVGCLVVMVSLLLAGSQSALMKKGREYSLSLLTLLLARSLFCSLFFSLVTVPTSLSGSLRGCNLKLAS